MFTHIHLQQYVVISVDILKLSSVKTRHSNLSNCSDVVHYWGLVVFTQGCNHLADPVIPHLHPCPYSPSFPFTRPGCSAPSPQHCVCLRDWLVESWGQLMSFNLTLAVSVLLMFISLTLTRITQGSRDKYTATSYFYMMQNVSLT